MVAAEEVAMVEVATEGGEMEVVGSEVVVAVAQTEVAGAQTGRRLEARVEEKVLVDSAAEWRGLAAVAVEDLVGVVVVVEGKVGVAKVESVVEGNLVQLEVNQAAKQAPQGDMLEVAHVGMGARESGESGGEATAGEAEEVGVMAVGGWEQGPEAECMAVTEVAQALKRGWMGAMWAGAEEAAV